jgi:hypothetical protein
MDTMEDSCGAAFSQSQRIHQQPFVFLCIKVSFYMTPEMQETLNKKMTQNETPEITTLS